MGRLAVAPTFLSALTETVVLLVRPRAKVSPDGTVTVNDAVDTNACDDGRSGLVGKAEESDLD